MTSPEKRVERLEEAADVGGGPDPVNALRSAWTPHDGGQDVVLDTDARFRIIACGRRWGKTELASYTACEYALENAASLVWWVAPNYNQADVGVDTVRRVLPESVGYDLTRSEPKNLRFANGSEISFRSADHPDTLRGVGLDYLVIDEAAMVSPEAWHEALRPTLADTEGGMMAISTPMARNWFYKLYERGRDPDDYDAYASFRWPTQANPYISQSEIDEARRSIPERAFRQEYEAEFVSGSGAVFANLENVVVAYDWEQADGEPPYATGVDFARHQDHTVILTLDSEGRLVYFKRLQGASWPQIQHAVERAHGQYDGPVSLDATRDNKIVADLEDAGVRVRPVKFTTQKKTSLVENLVTEIEQAELRLPESLQEPLLRELELFEFEVTKAGNVRYQAPPGFHDDCVDALSLAADLRKVSSRGGIKYVGDMAELLKSQRPSAAPHHDRRRLR